MLDVYAFATAEVARSGRPRGRARAVIDLDAVPGVARRHAAPAPRS